MTAEIESQRLLQSFLSGAKGVIDKREELNRINVFPVADNDTGNNLASLMQSIVDHVEMSTTIETLLNEVAEAALSGARGNSGIIFAQYFHAVADEYSQAEKSAFGFVLSLKKAVSKAYEALLEPKEGTILTVMRTWADALFQEFESKKELSESFLFAQKEAKQAVKETEFQLTLLRKNRLVDSGAQGFYYFISHFTASYCNEFTILEERTTVKFSEPAFHEIIETTSPEFRYCTEFILSQPTITKEELRTRLQSLGDSLIIAGNEKKLKVHIHTNRPKEVMEITTSYGSLGNQKVDDMQLQYMISQNRKYPIAIVTDSVADLPQSYLLEEQVHVLPMNILVNNQSFLDKLTIDAQQLTKQIIEEEQVSTAQPSMKSVDALLSYLEDKYEQVLVITVSAKLSGTNQLITQRIQAGKFPSHRIKVIDSKVNSVAQGLIVQKAVAALKENLPFEAVIETVEQAIQRTFIYVSVADLTPMIRSGRIPNRLGRIAKKLTLFPLVSLDGTGKGKLIGSSFSQSQSVKKMSKKISKWTKTNKIEALAITHVENSEGAYELNEQLGACANYIVESSSAIAISAGAGSIAVAVMKKEDKK